MKTQETGRILIYKNWQKKEGDKSPPYRGGMILKGITYDISLWMQETRSGKKYFSGTMKPAYDVHNKPKLTFQNTSFEAR
jgi:hypothetical protein